MHEQSAQLFPALDQLKLLKEKAPTLDLCKTVLTDHSRAIHFSEESTRFFDINEDIQEIERIYTSLSDEEVTALMLFWIAGELKQIISEFDSRVVGKFLTHLIDCHISVAANVITSYFLAIQDNPSLESAMRAMMLMYATQRQDQLKVELDRHDEYIKTDLLRNSIDQHPSGHKGFDGEVILNLLRMGMLVTKESHAEFYPDLVSTDVFMTDGGFHEVSVADIPMVESVLYSDEFFTDLDEDNQHWCRVGALVVLYKARFLASDLEGLKAMNAELDAIHPGLVGTLLMFLYASVPSVDVTREHAQLIENSCQSIDDELLEFLFNKLLYERTVVDKDSFLAQYLSNTEASEDVVVSSVKTILDRAKGHWPENGNNWLHEYLQESFADINLSSKSVDSLASVGMAHGVSLPDFIVSRFSQVAPPRERSYVATTFVTSLDKTHNPNYWGQREEYERFPIDQFLEYGFAAFPQGTTEYYQTLLSQEKYLERCALELLETLFLGRTQSRYFEKKMLNMLSNSTEQSDGSLPAFWTCVHADVWRILEQAGPTVLEKCIADNHLLRTEGTVRFFSLQLEDLPPAIHLKDLLSPEYLDSVSTRLLINQEFSRKSVSQFTTLKKLFSADATERFPTIQKWLITSYENDPAIPELILSSFSQDPERINELFVIVNGIPVLSSFGLAKLLSLLPKDLEYIDNAELAQKLFGFGSVDLRDRSLFTAEEEVFYSLVTSGKKFIYDFYSRDVSLYGGKSPIDYFYEDYSVAQLLGSGKYEYRMNASGIRRIYGISKDRLGQFYRCGVVDAKYLASTFSEMTKGDIADLGFEIFEHMMLSLDSLEPASSLAVTQFVLQHLRYQPENAAKITNLISNGIIQSGSEKTRMLTFLFNLGGEPAEKIISSLAKHPSFFQQSYTLERFSPVYSNLSDLTESQLDFFFGHLSDIQIFVESVGFSLNDFLVVVLHSVNPESFFQWFQEVENGQFQNLDNLVQQVWWVGNIRGGVSATLTHPLLHRILDHSERLEHVCSFASYLHDFSPEEDEQLKEAVRHRSDYQQTEVSSFLNFLIQSKTNLPPLTREQVSYFLSNAFSVVSNPKQSHLLIQHPDKFATIAPEKLITYIRVLSRMGDSPSQEIQHLKDQIALQILDSPNPEWTLAQIEEIFIKNNLPFTGKVMRVFDALYPQEKVVTTPMRSPNLRALGPLENPATFMRLRMTLYKDLAQAHALSGNRSLRDYLQIVQESADLIQKAELDPDNLQEIELKKLTATLTRLEVLYANTVFGTVHPIDQIQNTVPTSLDRTQLLERINQLRARLKTPAHTTIVEQVVSHYVRPLGFSHPGEVLSMMQEAKTMAHQRGLALANTAQDEHLQIQPNDLLKGTQHIYFSNILQNGSVAKEFLGASATSDSTPLDTDLAKVLPQDVPDDFTPEAFFKVVSSSKAMGYGNMLFVVRDRGQLIDTSSGPQPIPQGKYELFLTQYVDAERHVGIRTGFPSTEIDFIIVKPELAANTVAFSNICFSIAENGFYIPIVDQQGKILFSPEQYAVFHRAFNGLSYFSDEPLVIDEVGVQEPFSQRITGLSEKLDNKRHESQKQLAAIRAVVQEVLSKYQIILRDEYDTSILGADLQDTGSTSRNTATIGGNSDFDLMLMLDPAQFSLAQNIFEDLRIALKPEQDKSHTEAGYFQIKAVGCDCIEGNKVDIDVGIQNRAQVKVFSSHEAVQSKLEWIEEHYGHKMLVHVEANIVLAKEILKEASAYSKMTDGGMGGMGVENWILANGGNINQAFKTFYQAAHDLNGERIPFSVFQQRYPIYDPGINLKFGRHDNYVYVLKEKGYFAMLDAIQSHLLSQ